MFLEPTFGKMVWYFNSLGFHFYTLYTLYSDVGSKLKLQVLQSSNIALGKCHLQFFKKTLYINCPKEFIIKSYLANSTSERWCTCASESWWNCRWCASSIVLTWVDETGAELKPIENMFWLIQIIYLVTNSLKKR